MDNGTYLVLSKELSLLKNLELIAANVSNAKTTAFKKNLMSFSQLKSPDVSNNMSFSMRNTEFTDFTQGSMRATGRHLDVSLRTDSVFFMLQTPLGIRYTRDGSFTKDNEGRLVSMAGKYPVLSADGGEIVFNPADSMLSINSEGQISTKERVVGTIGVAKFERMQEQELAPVGRNMYKSPNLHTQSQEHEISQGALEQSNVSGIQEVSRMIEVQRHAQVMSKFITSQYSAQKNLFKKLSSGGN